jgi:predicted GNAT family N-acyltransferase
MGKSGQDKNRFSFTVTEAPWEQYQDAIQQIRNAVFVNEQHIPTELEWDGSDKDCIHVLAHDDQGESIGTGRIQIHPNNTSDGSNTVGHIGRIAVLKQQRGHGVGSALLARLADIARTQQLGSVYLNAQKHLQSYYERHRFEREGDVFKEAGIPHVRMVCTITKYVSAH